MLLIPVHGFASNSSLMVFYPLPTQAEGKVFAAKQLFLADGGGIWLQDVRNQVLFFDGQNITPEVGSALEFEAEQVAFLDNAFWTFFQNEIYRTVPNQEKELIFSLTPGSEILRIGASKRIIWVSDERNFYTYNVDTGEFQTFSLMELYQYNQSSKILINDAQFIYSRWVLATNAGVYLSRQGQFEHVASSGKHYVEKLYFSENRRELIIGSLNGALIFDITAPNKPIKSIAGSHVLSITETSQEYWIGTEKGLFVYSFLTGETKRFDQGFLAGNALSGEKIYSLLNDGAGGVWVATDRGVRYFSLFSQKFERFPSAQLTFNNRKESLIKLTPAANHDGYWALSNSGLYRISLSNIGSRTLIYQGKVHDFEESNGVLWLATDQGIVCIDSDSGEVIDDSLPRFLKDNSVRFVELDNQNVVWGASQKQVWSYDLSSGNLTQYGSEWMIDKYLPAQLTHMHVTNQGYLSLGTEHGVYLLKDGQVHFVGESVPYGEVIDIIQPADNELWIASRYGLYQLDLYLEQAEPIMMVDGHITPKCLLQNQDGIWVTSSTGLSRYSPEGTLIHHYGEPFGLINNEFSPGLCSYSNDSQRTLLFGADSSLVKVNTHELVVSRLPDIQVIFSQIKRDQALYSLGNTLKERPSLGYQESITFQFGVLPRANNLNLEYRLNEGAEWQALDGTTLTIEHLMPGSYTLDVRALRNGVLQGQSNSYQFYVTEPWFMTNSAIVAYIVVLIVVIVTSVYWRSRIMSTANRELKAQIALKTNQLRHQSRILLTNNQQLRKQLQVRRLIFTQSVNALKDKLATYAENGEANSIVKQLSRELDLLASTRSTNGQALPVHNLTLIIQSALSGWTEEFSKAGIHVELEAENDLYVSLTHFNLDELFNLLFDGIVKRCYRNQTVVIQLSRRNDLIAFAMLDQGEELESDSILTSTLHSLRSLVEQSGGEMTSHVSDERNLIEIAWQASDIFDEDSIVAAPSNQESAVFEDDDPWLEKVITLVEDNYTNAEFGTSVAAKMLFVSERSLQRRVKSATEKTFTEYLTEVRLDNACRRLLAGEKVSEVAFECGFNDPSYFSQRFKHRFGMPPTQFVEQQDRH